MKFEKIAISLLVIFLTFGSNTNLIARQLNEKELISPIHGKLMLIGTGEMTARVRASFAFLAGEEEGKLVILKKDGGRSTKIHQQWQSQIGNVKIIALNNSNNSLSKVAIEALRKATAVWLTDDFSKGSASLQLATELKDLLRRDGIVGGQGIAAESIATLIKDSKGLRNGFNLLPNSCICTSKNSEKFVKTLNSLPGRVGWKIPPQAAVVIHNSRQISVVGYPSITLRTAANGDWPERVESFGPPIDEFAFSTDLVSWNRSAVARKGELWPPAVAPVPEVPNGALIIIGGHGYPSGMWERVVKFAGGKDANFVCFSQSASSTGAKKLRELGCENIAVHVVKTGTEGVGQADNSQLLEDLEKADVVYFGGGRSYKFMDAFLNTKAHELMHKVLERGGMILGGSAGAQIQGDFLVRGDPRTNNTLWMEGNDVGLGFIKGVILDVHFRERGRENISPKIMVENPQLLGIGIDETTAIFVQGTTAEVLGPHTVTFYDLKNVKDQDPSSANVGNPVILMAGEKYDLKNRKKIDK